MHVCIYPTPPPFAECDTEFEFSFLSLRLVAQLSLKIQFALLPIVGGKRDGFLPFQRVLAQFSYFHWGFHNAITIMVIIPLHIYLCVCIHTYICSYVFIYMHTHMYTHTFILRDVIYRPSTKPSIKRCTCVNKQKNNKSSWALGKNIDRVPVAVECGQRQECQSENQFADWGLRPQRPSAEQPCQDEEDVLLWSRKELGSI